MKQRAPTSVQTSSEAMGMDRGEEGKSVRTETMMLLWFFLALNEVEKLILFYEWPLLDYKSGSR